jgi:hypothetical protein
MSLIKHTTEEQPIMIYFLVKGKISRSEYMCEDEAREFVDTRLVMAHDAEEAAHKYVKYWEGKTEEYSHYYYVTCEVLETLV